MALEVRADLFAETGYRYTRGGVSKKSLYIVSGLSWSPIGGLEAAALLVDGIPFLREPHPEIGNLWCVGLEPRAVSQDTVYVTVTWQNDLIPPGGDPSRTGMATIRGSANLQQYTTNTDAQGNPIILGANGSYSYTQVDNDGHPILDGNGNPIIVTPHRQLVNLPATDVQRTLRFERVERDIYPEVIASTFVGRINSVDWEVPGDANDWKCFSYIYDSKDGGYTWSQAWEFIKAVEWPDGTTGWAEKATYQVNGQPDPNATLSNGGQMYVLLEDQADFNLLNLFA